MITVRYGEGGAAYADHLCEKALLLAEQMNRDELFFTNTANMVDAARCLKSEGRITDLRIEYQIGEEEPEDLQVDDDGRLPYWPKGFCDHTNDWLDRLIRNRLKEPDGAEGQK